MIRQFGPPEVLFLLKAAQWTVLLSLVAFVGGGLVGFAFALLRTVRFRPANWLAVGYVQALQGTPLLAQLFVFYFGQTDLIATANIVALDLIKKNPAKNIELKFVIRLSPAHIAIRHGEPNLLRWLDTFIFFHKLNGNIGKLHEKWFNEKMQELPTF